jgi:hypothetical protein
MNTAFMVVAIVTWTFAACYVGYLFGRLRMRIEMKVEQETASDTWRMARELNAVTHTIARTQAAILASKKSAPVVEQPVAQGEA